MRADVTQYDLIAPPTLAAALSTLAERNHTPIAGGTELMVALAAGRLPRTPLMSIQHLRELRFVTVTPDSIVIGSGTTFTDLRSSSSIVGEFPLLSQAAGWTGSIANQNRGTLGGNIVNASPAADSPPALLAYEAELTLVHHSGSRTIPYADFHLGYKKTALLPGELLYSITLRRNFAGYRLFTRKVGTRNAQAISKVAIAALALVGDGPDRRIQDVRIGAASLRETPTRCRATERALLNQSLTPDTLPTLSAVARAALAGEVQPIDDIRSTARYRAAVAANLVEEFLQTLL